MTEGGRSASLPAESRGDAPGRGRMNGRRVAVIGAGQTDYAVEEQPVGNGRAIARLLGREGAAVAAVDRDAASAAETARLIGEEGAPAAVAVEADVSDPGAIESAVAEAHRRLGGLDSLVYNVGVPGAQTLEATTAEAWGTTVDVNLRGAMLASRAALRLMDPGGAFVYISSIASIRPTGRLVAYEASKAALGAIMRAVGFEGRDRGIRSNIVMLGMIDTGLGRSADGSTPRADVPIALGRFGTGWETAYATVFLLSHEAAYITGQILAVDGGRTTL